MRTSSSFGLPRAFRLIAAGALCLLVASAAARADVIWLEGGGRVRGEIISETPTQVVVRTATGSTHVIKRDEIAKIERDRNPEQEFAERSKRIAEGDAGGWFELGKFADSKGLKEKADEAFKKAIAFDPEHAGARAALGHRKHKGRWYDEVGYKKAVEGLVEHQGQWVTPREKELLEQGFVKNDKGEWVRAEDLAREDADRKAAEERERRGPPKPAGGGATETPPARPTPSATGGGGTGGGSKSKVKDVEPEDNAWFDDHTTVMSWDDALKQPYESKYYKIYSNLKPEFVKRYGLMLDVYNQMGFQRVFNAAENLKHGFPKGSIYIYPSHEEFKTREGMGDGVGGYYQPGQNRVVCYHGRFGMSGTTRTVLVHEATHQFEDFVLPGKMWNAPVWIIEGFAVFFESAYFDAKEAKVKIGYIPRDRLANLKQGIAANQYIPLPELIRTPQPAFTGYHYAHAWSLIYFIIYSGTTEKERKRRQEIFSKLFFLARTKQVTPEDVEALWGGKEKFAAWEEEWKKWLLELPYDWDPKEGLEGGARRRDPNAPGEGDDGGGAGKRGGSTETPDPGPGQPPAPPPDEKKPDEKDPQKEPSEDPKSLLGYEEIDRLWRQAVEAIPVE